ncbi:MAG: Bacterial domain [Thermoleophilaceae bacterium]|nr:Bacterial domain [Thermoleophilaceae bacterium]
MKSSVASRLRKRKTLEAAARSFRDAQGAEHDEILAAQRALRRAEHQHDRAVARAERDLAIAPHSETEAAEGRLAAAQVERLGIEEARPFLERVAALTEPGERVLDMAPGISTGHDGVLVVTDQRILFVGLRHTVRMLYDAIHDVSAHGKHLGARLVVSTASGKTVVSGIPPRHAAEITELARRHMGAASSTR